MMQLTSHHTGPDESSDRGGCNQVPCLHGRVYEPVPIRYHGVLYCKESAVCTEPPRDRQVTTL